MVVRKMSKIRDEATRLKTIVTDRTDAGRVNERFIEDHLALVEDFADSGSVGRGTGWAYYVDTQYTETSPQIIQPNTPTEIVITPTAATSEERELPEAYKPDGMWHSNRIRGLRGDSFSLRWELFAKKANNQGVPQRSMGNNVGIWMWLDIGLAAPDDKIAMVKDCARGRGIEPNDWHRIGGSADGFNLQTWEQNGARLMLQSTQRLAVWHANIFIRRCHAGQVV
ncbi:MAG: hypothetical protein AAFV46_00165 [Cyanobacteria bacterium J06635_11]